MKLHRTPAFFAAWQALPHGPFNRVAAALMMTRLPKPLLERLISGWIARAGIDMRDFDAGPFESLQAFFLRGLAPGARPLDDGFVSPADGRVVAVGTVREGELLQIKGSPYTLAALCGPTPGGRPLADWEGAGYATIFLSPDGYHHLHAPCDGTITRVRWWPGVHLPQNEDAVRHIESIYPRNERVTVTLRTTGGDDVLLVLVAASLVGGIHLDALAQDAFMQEQAVAVEQPVTKGDRFAHFAFGSTVVVIARGDVLARVQVDAGDRVLMGRGLAVCAAPPGVSELQGQDASASADHGKT